MLALPHALPILQETLLPFRVESFGLRTDSGGAGKFRGGLGFRKCYKILAPCLLQTNLDRTKYGPWGVLGGKDGQSGKRSEEHTSELQSLMRISYAVFCLKKTTTKARPNT